MQGSVPEAQQLLEKMRDYLPQTLSQELEAEVQSLVQVSREYRSARNQALEANTRLLQERERLEGECVRYRAERNRAELECDLFRELLRSEEQPAIRPYLSGVLDALIALSRAEKGIMMVFAAAGEVRGEPLEMLARNCDEEDIAIVREQLELSQGIVRRAISTGAVVYTEEAITDARFQQHASVRLLRLRTVLCAPLLDSDDKALGILYLEHRSRMDAFPPRDREMIELVAQHVACWSKRQMIVSRTTESLDHTTVYRKHYGFREIIGKSKGLAEVLRLMTLSLDLNSTAPVLISGEAGTGKSLIARALHFNSPRARGPFVIVNCASDEGELLEQRLFGQVKGAFNGANKNQPGKLESAEGGTLYLSEVAALSLEGQGRLLKVLLERETSRLGEERGRKVDVRIIVATRKDLRELIKLEKFREDLLFRLDVFPIQLPPLRERPGDIAMLAEHFVATRSQQDGRELVLSTDALAFLQQCELPGNVQELDGRLRQAIMHSTDGVITAAILSEETHQENWADDQKERRLPKWKEATAAFQRQLVVEALRRTDRNLVAAAEMLGISRQHLSRLLHELDLNEYRPAHRGRKRRS